MIFVEQVCVSHTNFLFDTKPLHCSFIHTPSKSGHQRSSQHSHSETEKEPAWSISVQYSATSCTDRLGPAGYLHLRLDDIGGVSDDAGDTSSNYPIDQSRVICVTF